MRHIGIPLPEPLINYDMLIGLVVIVGVAMLVLLKQPRSLAITSIASIFNNDTFFAKNATIGDHVKHYILLALSIVGASLFINKLFIPNHFCIPLIGKIALSICCFLGAKLFLMTSYFSLFFGRRHKTLIYQYISLIIVLGFTCYIGYVLLQFSPFIPLPFILTIVAIIGLCITLAMIYILLKDFFNRGYLIFHFILYLCTLEILPILAIIKWVV
jgi:hypothetical protein